MCPICIESKVYYARLYVFSVEVIINLQLHGLIFTYFRNTNKTSQARDGGFERFLKVLLNEYIYIYIYIYIYVCLHSGQFDLNSCNRFDLTNSSARNRRRVVRAQFNKRCKETIRARISSLTKQGKLLGIRVIRELVKKPRKKH